MNGESTILSQTVRAITSRLSWHICVWSIATANWGSRSLHTQQLWQTICSLLEFTSKLQPLNSLYGCCMDWINFWAEVELDEHHIKIEFESGGMRCHLPELFMEKHSLPVEVHSSALIHWNWQANDWQLKVLEILHSNINKETLKE